MWVRCLQVGQVRLVGGKIVMLKVGMEREVEPFKDKKGKEYVPDYLEEISAPKKEKAPEKEGAKSPPTVGAVSVKKAEEKKAAKEKLEDL